MRLFTSKKEIYRFSPEIEMDYPSGEPHYKLEFGDIFCVLRVIEAKHTKNILPIIFNLTKCRFGKVFNANDIQVMRGSIELK